MCREGISTRFGSSKNYHFHGVDFIPLWSHSLGFSLTHVSKLEVIRSCVIPGPFRCVIVCVAGIQPLLHMRGVPYNWTRLTLRFSHRRPRVLVRACELPAFSDSLMQGRYQAPADGLVQIRDRLTFSSGKPKTWNDLPSHPARPSVRDVRLFFNILQTTTIQFCAYHSPGVVQTPPRLTKNQNLTGLSE